MGTDFRPPFVFFLTANAHLYWFLIDLAAFKYQKKSIFLPVLWLLLLGGH
jgi:hypothetical protein